MKRATKISWATGGLVILALLGLAFGLGWFQSDHPGSDSPIASGTGSSSATTPATSAPSPSSASSVVDPGSTITTSSTTAPTLPPTTTTTTLPEAEPEVDGEGMEDPVPLGQAIELGTWRVGVSEVELDGTQTVLDFVDFNDPPAEGHQFVLVELSGVSLGSTISQPVFDWALVNDDFSHVPEGLECGVLPNSIYDVGDVPPGTQFTAKICFEIPSSEVNDSLLLSLDLLDRSQPTKFFLLR